MSNYKINGVDMSDFDILSLKANPNDYAVVGALDFPKRLGDVFYEWAESDVAEFFTDVDDIMFDGRDITFTGLIKGDRAYTSNKIKALNKLLSTRVLVSFQNPFGSHNIYVKNMDVETRKTLAKLTINMREPQVSVSSATLPPATASDYSIDGIPFSSFGMQITNVQGLNNIGDMNTQYSSEYNKDKSQVTGRKVHKITIGGYIKSTSESDLSAKLKAFYYLLSKPNARVFKLNLNGNVKAICADGMQVSDIRRYAVNLYAKYKLTLVFCGTI